MGRNDAGWSTIEEAAAFAGCEVQSFRNTWRPRLPDIAVRQDGRRVLIENGILLAMLYEHERPRLAEWPDGESLIFAGILKMCRDGDGDDAMEWLAGIVAQLKRKRKGKRRINQR